MKDGLLITGQNPASSGPAAKVLIDTLKALGHAPVQLGARKSA